MIKMALALEDLALGEVTLEDGAETIKRALSDLNEETASELYQALRSWLWKTLDARRRDEELHVWLDMLSRVSARFEEPHERLALKLEGFIELLQTSIMTAAAAAHRNSLTRKHVRESLLLIHKRGGRIRRQDLLTLIGLKAANLSRVMTPLLDDGLVSREVEGREVLYRLTMKGVEAAKSLEVQEGPPAISGSIDEEHITPPKFGKFVILDSWRFAKQGSTALLGSYVKSIELSPDVETHSHIELPHFLNPGIAIKGGRQVTLAEGNA